MAANPLNAVKLTAASGTSCSGSVSATAGNALIVGTTAYVAGGSSSAAAVTRTGDTYTTNASGDSPSGIAQKAHAAISSAPNVAGGAVTMSVNVGGANGLEAYAIEVSGLPTSGIFDVAAANATGTSGSPATNAATNTQADALAIGVIGNEDGSNPSTVTPGAGYTDTVNGTTMKETNGSAQAVGGAEVQVISSIASRTATWTTGNVGFIAVFAYFKATAGATVSWADIPPVWGIVTDALFDPDTNPIEDFSLINSWVATSFQVFTQALSGGLSFVGGLVRADSKPLTGGLSFSGAFTKLTNKPLVGGLSFVGALTSIKVAVRVLAGGLSFVGAFVKTTLKNNTGGLTFSGSLSKFTSRVFAGGLSFVGSIQKRTSKAFPGGLSFSGAFNAVKLGLKTLTGGLSFSGAFSKMDVKSLAGGLAFSGSLLRGGRKTIAGVVSFVGGLQKAIGSPLTGNLSFSGLLGLRKTLNLTAGLTFVGNLSTSIVASAVRLIFVTVRNVSRFLGGR